MTSEIVPRRNSARRSLWSVAVAAVIVLAGVVLITVAATPPSAVRAANIAIGQCNDVGPGAAGATTGMDCDITVVNTISSGVTSSTVTMTRLCTLDPCPSGNGTFTTSSADLVTAITQCNGSGNDAAHPTSCTVSVTNNISDDTPGASLTMATVNQCVGSGGGGGGTLLCDPFPASTTTATVTQCNGSGNGGGATVDCAVGAAARVSAAIPITINQCNGTANPGGSMLMCRTSIITNLIPAAAPTGTPTVTATPTATATVTVPPTATATVTVPPTATATVTVPPTATATVTVPPTATATVTVPPTATATVTVPPTATATVTVPPTATATVTVAPTLTAVPTLTAAPTLTVTATATVAPTVPSPPLRPRITATGNPPANVTGAPPASTTDGPPQVVLVPSGPVETGGGSTAVEHDAALGGLGGVLLLAAALSALRLRRTTRSRED